VSKLINELASEIQSSNPDLSSEEISAEIVTLMENEVLPLVIDRLRLPRLPSPMELRIDAFRQARRRGTRDRDSLTNKIGFVRELEKLRRNYYASDSTYSGFKTADPIDFSRRSAVYFADHWKRRIRRVPLETGLLLPKLGSESFADMSERKAQKTSELVTFDSSISKKIASDPCFEKTIARVESGIRQRFKEIPSITFDFSLRKDIDDLTRERTVIRVRIPNSSFREKMNYWLRIDLEVRKTIKALDLCEAEKRAISRNFVTHVEPT
jgi:hypothetical protein